jgi:Ca2+-binding RTX toxin-like protein
MSPGTQIENAFGGDGNDVLVGLRDGKSILRGNEGSDVLLAYGAGSTLDGGNADDWLWLGGNTTAVGGQGNDRFVVFQGEGVLTNTAAVRARMSDFDTAQDSLMVYDAAGNFKLAQFDAAGNLTGWAAVTNTSVLQTLQGQLAQSAAPDVLGVVVSGSASAPTLTLT